MSEKSFGLTTTTGYVEGESIHYELVNGVLTPANDPLAQLSSAELEEISLRATADMIVRKDIASRFASSTADTSDL